MDDKFDCDLVPERFYKTHNTQKTLIRKLWRRSKREMPQSIDDLDLFINAWSEESITVHNSSQQSDQGQNKTN